MMAEADRKAGPEHGYWMDGWDGYAVARGRLLDALSADPRATRWSSAATCTPSGRPT